MPNVFEINPEVPPATTRELIAYAKANPGKLSFGSAGIGTTSHMAGELFKMMTGVDLLHVPFRGNGPSMTAVLGGQVQAAFADMISSVEAVRAGKLRGLAVTTATRSSALPDLPTVAEAGVPGYEASSWFGLGAPKGTPPEIVERLNREINAGLTDAQVRTRLANVGGTVIPGTPADFRKVVTDENAIDISCRVAERVDGIGPVADQAAAGHVNSGRAISPLGNTTRIDLSVISGGR